MDTGYRQFIDGSNELSYGMNMTGENQIIVLLNGDQDAGSEFSLPPGIWTILANANQASTEGLGSIEKVAEVAEQSGLILVQ